MSRVVVIGAGFGGLSAALSLAAAGHAVTVIEQAASAGGKAGEVVSAGYRFDTGPTLLTMPEVLRDLFARAGADIDQHLVVKRLEPLCRYFFPGGEVVTATHDREAFAQELHAAFGEPREHLERYLEYARRIYEITKDVFLFRPVHEAATLLRWGTLRSLSRIASIDPFRTAHAANESFFDAPEVVQLFDRYATYSGSDPYRAPATLNVIPHIEYTLGSYTVEGGFANVARVIRGLFERVGGVVRCGDACTRIEHRNGAVTSVRLASGASIDCDAVVCNADAVHCFSRLLPEFAGKRARLERLEPSSSGVVFLWGVEGSHERLDHHNIFFGEDYRAEFRQLFDERRMPDDPTVYVSISSKAFPGDAPRGGENWFVLLNAPWLGDGEVWNDGAVADVREKVFRAIERRGFDTVRKSIRFESVITPEDFARRTSSNRGSIYGLSSNSRWAAFNRQPNRARELDGLFFAGGSAHPGGGVPLTVLSGMMAADLAAEYLR